MNFIEELQWRGLLQDMSPGLDEEMTKGTIKGYIGFDPTAPSLTIGNLVSINLRFFSISTEKMLPRWSIITISTKT